MDACRERLPGLAQGQSSGWARNALGNAYLFAHRGDQASEEYRVALAVIARSGTDYAQVSANLALALAEKDPDGAVGWLEKAVAADPGFTEARVNLALLLSMQRPGSGPSPAAAEAHLRKVLELLAGRDSPEASRTKARTHWYLANLLFDRAYAEVSSEAGSIALERPPPASIPPGGSGPSAPRASSGGVWKRPHAGIHVPGAQGGGSALEDCQTYDCILGLARERPRFGPPVSATGTSLLPSGVSAGGAGEPAPLRDHASSGPPARDWLARTAQAHRARLAAAADRFRPAAAEYEEAIRLDPWLTEARTNYGNLLRETGQLGAAVEQYRAAYCRDNADFVALSNLGQVLFQLGRCDEARRTLAQVRDLRSVFLPGENGDFGRHFLTSERLCISRIVDNPRFRLTSLSRQSSDTCRGTISTLTFWRTGVPMGPFALPDAGPDARANANGGASNEGGGSSSPRLDRAVVRVVATRFTRDPEPRTLAHFGGGVVVLREADSALIATAYHTLTFPGCVPTPAVNADDAVQTEGDLIRVQFLADGAVEREARIVWRAIRPGPVEDLALLRVTDVPPGLPAARVGHLGEAQAGAPLRMLSWSKTGEPRTIVTEYRGAIDHGRRLVTSDLGFQPGDSGAPVFGPGGAVVGLVAGASEDESRTG